MLSNAVHDCTEINVGSSKHFLRWTQKHIFIGIACEHTDRSVFYSIDTTLLILTHPKTASSGASAPPRCGLDSLGSEGEARVHFGTCPWQLAISEERSALIQSWADFGSVPESQLLVDYGTPDIDVRCSVWFCSKWRCMSL
jgi:hypothetical protein